MIDSLHRPERPSNNCSKLVWTEREKARQPKERASELTRTHYCGQYVKQTDGQTGRQGDTPPNKTGQARQPKEGPQNLSAQEALRGTEQQERRQTETAQKQEQMGRVVRRGV